MMFNTSLESERIAYQEVSGLDHSVAPTTVRRGSLIKEIGNDKYIEF